MPDFGASVYIVFSKLKYKLHIICLLLSVDSVQRIPVLVSSFSQYTYFSQQNKQIIKMVILFPMKILVDSLLMSQH